MELTRNIYFIYAIENEDYMLHLLRHLKPLEKDFNCILWHDDPIYTGQLWKPKNDSRISQTDISLLLVSDAFMHSEFVKQLEFKMIIDRYKAGKAIVIPILLEPCPWETDFKSDEYDFNLNELRVLPEGGIPITDWDAAEKAYMKIASSLKRVIAGITGDPIKEDPVQELPVKEADTTKEKQLAIRFSEEAEAKRKAGEEKQLKEEAEANRKTEEKVKRREEAKAKRNADEKLRIEEENRLKEKVQAKRKAALIAREEAEAKRRIEEQKSSEQEVVVSENDRDDDQSKPLTEAYGNTEPHKVKIKKRVLWGSLAVLLVAVGMWIISIINTSSEKEATPLPATKSTSEKDAGISPDTKEGIQNKPETLSKLSIGSLYEGGIVFTIDQEGKTGKIAHTEDAGPMTWMNAIKIHEVLGEGWRLPSFDELAIMYRNIGQGADNKGEFADGLYWSATAYDDYQARLLRFRDGNTTYHYNKELEHRKYLVRAIREFNR